MDHAGVSGTVTISDQKVYKNPREIHGALNEVRSEFTVDRSRVSY